MRPSRRRPNGVRGLDTDAIIRFEAADHAAQVTAARRAIEAGDFFFPMTMLVEADWLLRSRYGFSSEAIEPYRSNKAPAVRSAGAFFVLELQSPGPRHRAPRAAVNWWQSYRQASA